MIRVDIFGSARMAIKLSALSVLNVMFLRVSVVVVFGRNSSKKWIKSWLSSQFPAPFMMRCCICGHMAIRPLILG